MNWVDLVIVVVLLVFTLEGWGRSFFSEALGLAGFLLAFLSSLKFYNFAAKFFESTFSLPHSLANVLGFVAVWYLIETVFFVLHHFLLGYLPKVNPIKGEKVLSLVPAFLKGVVFVAIILVLVATFPVQPQIKRDTENSKIGSLLLSQTLQLEAPLKNIFGDIASDTLTFLTIKPKTDERVDLGFKTTGFNFDERLEMEMINLVNKERIKQGIPPLIYNPILRQIAQSHSADMFTKGYFSHYSPEGEDVADRAKKTDIDFIVIGENLAYAPLLSVAHQGLMNSPGHRANILSTDFHQIGVGIASSGDFGIMVTQVFKD